MPIVLPTEKSAALRSPRHLVIYSPPKTGKTALFAELENSLLLDLEGGSDFVQAIKVNISNYKELNEVCEEVKKAGSPYRYGIIDTATALEDQVGELALRLYQQTAMGKDFKGNVLSLPNGAGYLYLREAFDIMYTKVKDAFPRTILSCHTKDKNIAKPGNEAVMANDISLTGKLKQLVSAYADAIGYLKREGDNKCVITFKTSDEITCGVRSNPKYESHLRNQTFVLSEIVNGEYKTYWNHIYID